MSTCPVICFFFFFAKIDAVHVLATGAERALLDFYVCDP